MSPTLALTEYRSLDNETLAERINAIRQDMGPKLLILGHHYIQDAVLELTDLRGDSYTLSALAASNEDCRSIIFCGVHFMAETGDILANRPEQLASRNGQRVDVILPDASAGCSMADMATGKQVEECWAALSEIINVEEVMPVTYVNSTAELKAFCGRHGGIVCTSSNAKPVLEWAFARRKRVLFFPDQHLGRNTALGMGISPEAMPVWDPTVEVLGSNTKKTLQNSRVILWNGHCSVHQLFDAQDIERFRKADPDVKILVHPECRQSVVAKSDVIGSTSKIVSTVESSQPGTHWAIGTELNLVNRLRCQHPEQTIDFLAPRVCMCATMSQIDLPHLCWALENLKNNTPVNVVQVEEEAAKWALKALQRMLEIK